MSDELFVAVLGFVQNIEWPSSDIITSQSQEQFLYGLDVVNTYRGHPQVLVDALEAFQIDTLRRVASRLFRCKKKQIKTLPGFVEGFLYEQRDTTGNQHQVLTIAVWETEEAFENAKRVVGANDRQQGINRQEAIKQLGIELTRVVYRRSPY